MSASSLTPSTITQTSLKNKPVLRIVLRLIWFLFMAYVAYIVGTGIHAYASQFSGSGNLFQRITRIGVNLLAFSTIDIGSDLYVFIGYFALGLVIFIQRSDDWFAIFLSIMIVSFGVRVSSIIAAFTQSTASSYQASLVLMTAEAGIVLLGWLFPDGNLHPRWLRYLLPLLLLNVFLFYFPPSPLYFKNLNPTIYIVVNLIWYFSSGTALVTRYKSTVNPNQRQQIRWVYMGMIGSLIWFVLFSVPPLFFPILRDASTAAYFIFQVSTRLLGIILFLALPASITIAIARYKLFDIDLLINRALVYGALTVVLASFFAFALFLINTLLNLITDSQNASIGVVVAAIASGALFQPARKALQRLVDKSIYNIRIDYLKTPHGMKLHAEADTTTQAPVLFSRYNNLSLVGRGGMAEVYYAEHPTFHQPVAIKVLLSTLAEDEQYLKRFQREAKTLTALDHSNIVKLYEVGEENGLHYMVMEYLNGMNLSVFLKRRGKLDMESSLPILGDVASALDYAHHAGLVHRDIKPSNIMLDERKGALRAVLTDFGIVKVSTAVSNITATGMVGTFDYIAPEQIQALSEIDGRADIYSLGVMAYQLFTGELPFQRNSPGSILLAHMTTPPPDAREVMPTLSQHTSRAIQKAMAKRPADRFETAGEFIHAMAG